MRKIDIFFSGDGMKNSFKFIILFLWVVIPISITYAEVSMDKEGDGGISSDKTTNILEKEEIKDQELDDAEENSTTGNGLNLAKNAKSAIIIEASTGKVIYEKNADEKMAMASMTKMMTLLLIMENIENGNLKLDEMVTASENAASMGGSQIFLQVGEQMSVDDLLKGICIASGNDASVAMAERIGGTEENFVKMMNDKARELGLKNTNFVNSYGFDADDHYSSAYDMAMIAKELVKHEKILEYSGTYEDYLRKDTDNSFWLVNTNKLVRYYSGVDGLKTGFTDKAMYCLTATAKKDNMRLITVVMGEPDSSVRSSETASMLDYGFNTYQIDTLLSSKTVLDKVRVSLGEDDMVEVIASEDIEVLNNKTGNKRVVDYKVNIDNIKAPVKVGDKVGSIDVYEEGKVIMSVDATVNKNVDKANIFTIYLRNLKDVINGSV